MRVFFDTSVLVAASEVSHPHFAQADRAVLRAWKAIDQGFASMHSVAEVYAALTRLPVQPRIHPAEATRILSESILPHLELVPLEREDYIESLNRVAMRGWVGAKIYDALILTCATKCQAEKIYTFNVADFHALASDETRRLICSP